MDPSYGHHIEGIYHQNEVTTAESIHDGVLLGVNQNVPPIYRRRYWAIKDKQNKTQRAAILWATDNRSFTKVSTEQSGSLIQRHQVLSVA